ncbi:hypothetical protein P9112_001559 [Eukaryota sp. TZLM1-RC]
MTRSINQRSCPFPFSRKGLLLFLFSCPRIPLHYRIHNLFLRACCFGSLLLFLLVLFFVCQIHSSSILSNHRSLLNGEESGDFVPSSYQMIELNLSGTDDISFTGAAFASSERLVVVGFNHRLKDDTTFNCSIPNAHCFFLRKKGDLKRNFHPFALHFQVNVTDPSFITDVLVTPSSGVPATVKVFPHVPFNFSACLPTMFNMNLDRVADWINYYVSEHRLQSATLYVRKDFTYKDLNYLKNSTIGHINVTIVQVPDLFHNNKQDFFYHGQYQVINDCWMRSMGSEYVVFQDYDEFLTFSESVSSFEEFFNPDIGAITFGSQFYSAEHCIENDSSLLPTARMPKYLDPMPECINEELDKYECRGPLGRRKYIIKPQIVSHLNVHSPVLFNRKFKTLNVNAKDAIIRHYRGFIINNFPVCSKIISKNTLL